MVIIGLNSEGSQGQVNQDKAVSDIPNHCMSEAMEENLAIKSHREIKGTGTGDMLTLLVMVGARTG